MQIGKEHFLGLTWLLKAVRYHSMDTRYKQNRFCLVWPKIDNHFKQWPDYICVEKVSFSFGSVQFVPVLPSVKIGRK